jgi:hypothetical protein
MDQSFLDKVKITEMASGHLCLELSENVSWHTFPTFAERFLLEVRGKTDEKIDTSVIRLWKVTCRNVAVKLVFDDVPLMVSLESDSDSGDLLLRTLEKELRVGPE